MRSGKSQTFGMLRRPNPEANMTNPTATPAVRTRFAPSPSGFLPPAMERYPESPPELDRGGVVKLVKFFGPGAIIASVTIAAGLF